MSHPLSLTSLPSSYLTSASALSTAESSLGLTELDTTEDWISQRYEIKEFLEKIQSEAISQDEVIAYAKILNHWASDRPFVVELLRMDGLNVPLILKNLQMLCSSSPHLAKALEERAVVLKACTCLSKGDDRAAFCEFFQITAQEQIEILARREFLARDAHLVALQKAVQEAGSNISLEELVDIRAFAKELQSKSPPSSPVKHPSKKTGHARSVIHTCGDPKAPSNKVYLYLNQTHGSRIPNRDEPVSRCGSGGNLPKVIINIDTLEMGVCKRIDKQDSYIGDRQVLAEREAVTLSRIDSPYVIKTEGTFKTNDKMHILFPLLCNRGNLYEFLKKTPLTRRERIDIALQIARGFQDIHEAKFIHRDLKDENIVIHEKDGKYHVKIIDFELAIRSPRLSQRAEMDSLENRINNVFGSDQTPRQIDLVKDINSHLSISEVIRQLEEMLAQETWSEDLRKGREFDCSPSI